MCNFVARSPHPPPSHSFHNEDVSFFFFLLFLRIIRERRKNNAQQIEKKENKKKEDESRVARFMLRDGHKSVETEQGEQGDTQKKKKGIRTHVRSVSAALAFFPL